MVYGDYILGLGVILDIVLVSVFHLVTPPLLFLLSVDTVAELGFFFSPLKEKIGYILILTSTSNLSYLESTG